MFLLCCLSQLVSLSQEATEIFIGALLSSTENATLPEEKAFKLAIEHVNADTKNYPGIELRWVIRYADPDNDFDNIDRVNDLLSSNISILVGPMQTSAVLATHPLCLRARVPQIAPLTSLRLVPMETEGVNFLVRMSPTEALKAEVLKEIVKSFGWKTMAVYGYKDKEVSTGHSTFRLLAYELEWNVVAASLFLPDPKNPRDIAIGLATESLKEDNTRLAIVFCPAWVVSKLIGQVSSIDGVDPKKWTWIFSDFGNKEADLFNSSGFGEKESMRGLLGIKPGFAKGDRFQQFKHAWERKMLNTNFTVSAGRVYDSVLVAAEGIKRALRSGVDLSKPPVYFGFCEDLEQQPENTSGTELARHLNEVTVEGVMGKIRANDPDSGANFDVINLRADGQHKVGEWNDEGGLQMNLNETPIVWPSGSNKTPTDIPNILEGKLLRIATIVAPPFVMEKSRKGNSNDTETQEFEGLCIDILEEMRKELGFNYTIYLAPDGKFGVRDKGSREWNGVVKQLIDGKAHMSIAPMTISSERQAVIDFTQPYMTFGLAFIIRVKDVSVNYFRFLSPFDKSLWIALCVLIIVMSLLVWSCSIFSPWGYYGRCLQAKSIEKLDVNCLKEADTLSLSNSIWSSWKAYVRQGADHPNSWSGRITVSVFWFAVMIINATYTANLAAHLTVSRMQTPIETIFDLARQVKIGYGTLKDSQLQTFFQNTDVPSFLVMGQFMEQHKTWMPSYEAGINRTMAGDFAFISDRPILDFAARKKEYCGKLKVTGGFGNTYGYGFAFQKNSQYTPLFNVVLFKLQKDFKISSLTHKWMKEKAKCEMMDKFEEEKKNGDGVQMMTVQGMLGVFILLGISIVVGFVIMIVERIYASAKEKHEKRRRAASDRSSVDPYEYLQSTKLELQYGTDSDKSLKDTQF